MENQTLSPELSTEETSAKITEVLEELESEIQQYQKSLNESDEYTIYLKGHIAGLRKAKDFLNKFFNVKAESEVKNG